MAYNFTYLQYVDDVLNHKISVCKKVKQAVQRHVSDLKRAEEGSFPYYFDHKKAQKAILFFCQLVHTKGELAGQNLKPEPWQQFIIASIYGWRRVDNNTRRFRRVYVQVAKKNGKSFLAAGVGLYDLISEPGAEVICAATKRDQAAIVFNDANKDEKEKWHEIFKADCDEGLENDCNDLQSAFVTRLWYQGYDDVISKILDKLNEMEEPYPAIPYNEENGFSEDVWSMFVLMFGEYGTSPRFGWIEKVSEFRAFLQKILNEWEKEQ